MPPILAVDDELHLLTLYDTLLRKLGFTVVTAPSCAEALRCLREQPVSLVIADLRLPDGNGVDIIREARSGPAPIPSILVTGSGMETAQAAAEEAGADRYFTKPFSVRALCAAVRELMAATEVTQQTESAVGMKGTV